MTPLILAIDPGLTGAYALVEPDGEIVRVDDLPTIADLKTKWIDGSVLVDEWVDLLGERDVVGVIERVFPLPKNGAHGAFSQGMTLASLLVSLQMVQARIEFVAPQTWKRDLGLISKPDTPDSARKRMSIDKARMLFPWAPLDRQKDHGRAEALLIAHWYLNRFAMKAANKAAKESAKAAAKPKSPGTTRELFSEWLAEPETHKDPF